MRGHQDINVVLAEFGRQIQISDAECRPPTAAAIRYQRNFKAQRLQNPHCRNPDMRLVITHKSIVPKNDLASLSRGTSFRASGPCEIRGLRPKLRKPAIE